MKRFLKKALRWLGILFATLVVLLLVLYAEEDWRGTRDWAACQRDLAAKGETLDLRQLAPPGKPEDDLSKVPIFAPLYEKDYNPDASIYQLDAGLKAKNTSQEPDTDTYLKGTPLNLGDWQSFYRSIPNSGLVAGTASPAQDVLKVLSRFDSQLREINDGLNNPNSFFPLSYDQHSKGRVYVTTLIKVSQLLQLRGIAHLENGETDQAEKDYLSTFGLGSPLRRGGSIVGYIIFTSIQPMNNAVLWEGLHRHAWNQSQLQEMESALGKQDVLEFGQEAYRVGRANDVQDIATKDKANKTIESVLSFTDEDQDGAMGSFFLWARPEGWNLQDKKSLSWQAQKLIDAIDAKRGVIDKQPFIPTEDHNIRRAHYIPFTTLAMPILQGTGKYVAKAEIKNRLARLACRLEEYRIAHAQYPDQLADLPDMAPHLNQEVLSDQPFHYQRKGDSYTLYSIGWDQKDDGGALSTKDPKPQGDWPWPSP